MDLVSKYLATQLVNQRIEREREGRVEIVLGIIACVFVVFLFSF